MSLVTIIYLAELSSNLSLLFFMLGIIGSGVVAIDNITKVDTAKPFSKSFNIRGLLIIFLLFLISTLLPSKDTVYLMVGVDGVQNVVNTPEAAKARKVLNLGLDKIINNLQESSNSEK